MPPATELFGLAAVLGEEEGADVFAAVDVDGSGWGAFAGSIDIDAGAGVGASLDVAGTVEA